MLVNLRKYYPQIYTSDFYCDLPESIIETLDTYRKLEHALEEKQRYHSIGSYIDNITESKATVVSNELNPEKIYLTKLDNKSLYTALTKIPKKQADRIYAHYFLGLKKTEIAQLENTSETAIRKSINLGLENIKKFFLEGSI